MLQSNRICTHIKFNLTASRWNWQEGFLNWKCCEWCKDLSYTETKNKKKKKSKFSWNTFYEIHAMLNFLSINQNKKCCFGPLLYKFRFTIKYFRLDSVWRKTLWYLRWKINRGKLMLNPPVESEKVIFISFTFQIEDNDNMCIFYRWR